MTLKANIIISGTSLSPRTPSVRSVVLNFFFFFIHVVKALSTLNVVLGTYSNVNETSSGINAKIFKNILLFKGNMLQPLPL